ncbi:DUF3800 domain-containing protein [Bacillus cereus]|uniref:DUF3800 domain-containing protein n=1 Tax=Bacillus cereus TaxID=1396 RepID=UPI00115C6BA3|nr:DUF3800 domain-containing protein [Bacillus cereus]
MVNTRNRPCPCNSGKKYKQCCLKNENNFTIFCDESGNTGSNFIDREQPFYIIAGWMVPNKKLEEFSVIDKSAESLGIEGELHGTKLIKSKKAQQEFISLFNRLCKEIECIPIFIIAEKKYCIAAKIIETLLDPYYNDEVDNSYTYDNLKKKKLVEKLNNVPYEYLVEFINSYNEANPVTMENAIDLLCGFLESNNESDLSKKIKGSIKYLEDNLESEKKAREHLPKKTMLSLNLPVYISYITLLEKLGGAINAKFSLVHDKTQQFKESYSHIFDLYSDAESFESKLTDGNSILLGFKHLKEFSFEDSKESRWIQAADLLASVIGRVLKRVYSDEPIEAELLELARLTIPALMVNEIKMADSICFEETRKKLFRAIIASPN